MGWLTLQDAETRLIKPINEAELQLVVISGTRRTTERELAFDQMVLGNDKQDELRQAKEQYDLVRDQRPAVSSSAYAEWQARFEDAQENYSASQVEIEAYYEDLNAILEQEATDKEVALDQEQTSTETQLEAMRAEKEAVSEQVSSDIDNSKLNLS